ncbi:MAG TPA: hypothetical protein VMI33_17200 [Streptosporangiaceae bacterium]|nr:hypothetical protein [Streptosporangiaceae bacterium]
MADNTQRSIRFPAELMTQLRHAAEQERRTVTQQVLVYCERGLAEDGYDDEEDQGDDQR